MKLFRKTVPIPSRLLAFFIASFSIASSPVPLNQIGAEADGKISVNDAMAAYPVAIDPTITDADWTAMNSGEIYGTNGPVYAQVWYKGNLYVGGAFTFVGNIPASNIARWDGTRWDSLGSGIDSTVRALAFDSSGNLYTGGYFLHAGGTPVNQIARWDGNEWSPLGDGQLSIKGHNGGDISRIASIVADGQGNIYVGGEFMSINSIVTNNIAKWNGTEWSSLGDGVQANRSVLALALDNNGNLFAGGGFDSVSGIAAAAIARWDGAAWDSLGGGLLDVSSGTVWAIASDDNGNIYVGGSFKYTNTPAGGTTSMENIAQWNGSEWSEPGDGIEGTRVMALATDRNGRVYAEGLFPAAGSDTVHCCIVMYDGVSWTTLKQGLKGGNLWHDNVSSLAVSDQGILYAGGNFAIALIKNPPLLLT